MALYDDEPPFIYVSMARFGDSGYSAEIILHGKCMLFEVDALRELRQDFLDPAIVKEIDLAISNIESKPDLELLPEIGAKRVLQAVP